MSHNRKKTLTLKFSLIACTLLTSKALFANEASVSSMKMSETSAIESSQVALVNKYTPQSASFFDSPSYTIDYQFGLGGGDKIGPKVTFDLIEGNTNRRSVRLGEGQGLSLGLKSRQEDYTYATSFNYFQNKWSLGSYEKSTITFGISKDFAMQDNVALFLGFDLGFTFNHKAKYALLNDNGTTASKETIDFRRRIDPTISGGISFDNGNGQRVHLKLAATVSSYQVSDASDAGVKSSDKYTANTMMALLGLEI